MQYKRLAERDTQRVYLANCVKISTSLEQLKHHVVLSFLGGQMQRCQSVLHNVTTFHSVYNWTEAHDTRTKNRRQKNGVDLWRRFLERVSWA